MSDPERRLPMKSEAATSSRLSKEEQAQWKRLGEFLSSPAWQTENFRWDGELPSEVRRELDSGGWQYTPVTWFEQVTPSYKQEVSGYKFH